MDFFTWLFSDRTGVVCLVIGGMLVCLLISFVLERRTRKEYYNHEKYDDDWDLFDDEDADKYPHGAVGLRRTAVPVRRATVPLVVCTKPQLRRHFAAGGQVLAASLYKRGSQAAICLRKARFGSRCVQNPCSWLHFHLCTYAPTSA